MRSNSDRWHTREGRHIRDQGNLCLFVLHIPQLQTLPGRPGHIVRRASRADFELAAAAPELHDLLLRARESMTAGDPSSVQGAIVRDIDACLAKLVDSEDEPEPEPSAPDEYPATTPIHESPAYRESMRDAGRGRLLP